MYRQIRERFAVVLRTPEGHKFRGEFGDPGAYPRPRKEIQNLPHRALVTDRNSVAKAGDMVTHHGVEYLLCGQHVLEGTKRFLAVEVNARVTWYRLTKIIDPVTRMAKEDQLVPMDEDLSVCLEPQRSFEEANFTQSQDRLFTSADIREGDQINGKKVLRVNNLFGLKMVEIA